MVKEEPWPERLLSESDPPCSSATLLHMLRPNPVSLWLRTSGAPAL
jgi:hypothetical protein